MGVACTMEWVLRNVLVFVFFAFFSAHDAIAERWGKLDLDYTLRGPYSSSLSNWNVAGSATVLEGFIKFTPQMLRSPASLWTQKPIAMKSWEVILEFGVHGSAPLSTGEGLAFWLVSDPGSSGAVYGHSDKFSGLGVFFDSYDADANGEGEPYVLAMYNQGTEPIDADGAGLQLGVCFANYRNLPHPARAKIAYTAEDKHLTVGLDIENSGKFKSCISVKDVAVHPDVEHFGLTVSDYGSDFDIFSFLAVNMDQQAEPQAADKVNLMEIVDDVTTVGGRPVFESRAGFVRIAAKLRSLIERMTSLDEQFSKQFQAVFHNHNKALEHHVSQLQSEAGGKHTDVAARLESLVKHVDDAQRVIKALSQEVTGTSGRPSRGSQQDTVPIDALAKARVSCTQDNARGEAMVSQLRDMVGTLERRQNEIRNEVHGTLNEMDNILGSSCGTGFKVVAVALVGVVIGALVGSTHKSGGKRAHLP